MAATFFQQGSDNLALVLVESITKTAAAPARALALKAGEPRLAAQLFSRIRESDTSFSAPELEQALGNYLPRRPSPSLPPKAIPPPAGRGGGGSVFIGK